MDFADDQRSARSARAADRIAPDDPVIITELLRFTT
jgi:hypothetical protein